MQIGHPKETNPTMFYNIKNKFLAGTRGQSYPNYICYYRFFSTQEKYKPVETPRSSQNFTYGIIEFHNNVKKSIVNNIGPKLQTVDKQCNL
jgi:hypothetical protein